MKQADDLKTLELPLDGSPVKRKPGRKASGAAKSDARRAAEYRARQKMKPRQRPVSYDQLTRTTLGKITNIVQSSAHLDETAQRTANTAAWGMFALWNSITEEFQIEADRRQMEELLVSPLHQVSFTLD